MVLCRHPPPILMLRQARLVWPPRHPAAAVDGHLDALRATHQAEADEMVERAGEVGPLEGKRSGSRHL